MLRFKTLSLYINKFDKAKQLSHEKINVCSHNSCCISFRINNNTIQKNTLIRIQNVCLLKNALGKMIKEIIGKLKYKTPFNEIKPNANGNIYIITNAIESKSRNFLLFIFSVFQIFIPIANVFPRAFVNRENSNTTSILFNFFN